MQISVNGKIRNIINYDHNAKGHTTIFIDSDSLPNRKCACLSHIPSKSMANGRTFRTGGNTLKYL